MDKYDGMNKVEIKLTKNETVVNRPRVRKKGRGALKLFAIQLLVSALIGGGVFACKYIDTKVTAAVCESVRSMVTFDAVEYASGLIEEGKKRD